MLIKTVSKKLVHTLVSEFYFFAIPHHLVTFFSPFKRVSTTRTRKAIDLEDIGQAISYNLVSMGMGMILRFFVILTGLIVMLSTLILGSVVLLISLVLLPFSISYDSIKEGLQIKKEQEFIALANRSAGLALAHVFTKSRFGKFLAKKLAITEEEFKELTSENVCLATNHDLNNLKDLILVYAKEYHPLKSFLDKHYLDEKDLQRIFAWYDHLYHNGQNGSYNTIGIGSDWAYGYTNNLDALEVHRGTPKFPHVVGREEEITAITRALNKSTQNSVIVSGEPGVGRHAVVDEFVRRLYAGQVSPNLAGFRAIYLDISSALSNQKSKEDARKYILDLFYEAQNAGNVILVIDDIDRFMGDGDNMNLSDLFSQTLSEGHLKIIGVTSKELSDKHFGRNENLLKLFTPVNVESPDIETVYLEMEVSISPILEKEHRVEISYTAIKEAIRSADRFITNIPFPEKAITLLDETISFVKREHKKMYSLWGTDVQAYLSEKTKIPIGNLSDANKEKLINLEVELHEKVVGQEGAISALAKALRRAILEISSKNKPIGTFLFLGPTGVGKTETAKALASTYFGGENRLIRFDMSQYQGQEGINRLIGTSTSSTPGELTQAISDHPFSVLLLDEIEKSPMLILNLFLTLIDEGYLTDAKGKKYSAKQNIIIGTSNAGALFINDQIQKGTPIEQLNKDLVNYIQQQGIFSPEFLNRFDGIVVYRPLTRDELIEVTKKLLGGLKKRLAEKKVTLEFTNETIEKVVTEGYEQAFGARSIRRYIQDVIEDEVSKRLLGGESQKITI